MSKEKSDKVIIKKIQSLPGWLKYCLTGFLGIVIGVGGMFGYSEIKKINSPISNIESVFYKLQNSYYHKVPDSILEQGAISGMLSSLNDPFSEQLVGQNKQQINNVIQGASFGGVGIQMALKQSQIVVESVIADSPAAKNNVKPGDQILAIDGKEVSPDKFTEIVKMVRGKKGTKVNIKLKRDNSTFDVILTRSTIKQSSLTTRIDKNAMIITITQFDVNTADDLKKALKAIDLRKTPKLIIDLQDNPGGVMPSALKAASYFLPNGKTIMKYESRDSKKIIKSSDELSDGYHTSLKPIILINGNTASASEIFTAALVDNKRAITIGQKSFGKGTVQEVGNSGKTEFKYTIAKWLTPNGTWINHKGIKPMYPVEVSLLEQLPQFETDKDLKDNMMGLDVAILQQYLTALGYLNNHLTGIFDEQTKQALISFEKDQNLEQTGIFDATNRQRMYLVVMQKLQETDPALQKALNFSE